MSVFVTGLATGMLFAAVALVYNVMFSTSKVLSVTTGHISMLGGVFGAFFISALGWPWYLALLGAVAIGAAFGWLTEVLAIRRVLARSDEHLWLLSTLALATMSMGVLGMISRVVGHRAGSALTFAAVTPGGGSAPGQLALAELRECWAALGEGTAP